jgi:hypothetical protein
VLVRSAHSSRTHAPSLVVLEGEAAAGSQGALTPPTERVEQPPCRTRTNIDVVRDIVSRITAAAPSITLERRVCARPCRSSTVTVRPVDFLLVSGFALLLECARCGRRRGTVGVRLRSPDVFLQGRKTNGHPLSEDMRFAIAAMLRRHYGPVAEIRPTAWEHILEESVGAGGGR